MSAFRSYPEYDIFVVFLSLMALGKSVRTKVPCPALLGKESKLKRSILIHSLFTPVPVPLMIANIEAY